MIHPMSRLFSIGDLHISKSNDKPMNVFGSNWDNHVQRICDSWAEIVKPEDLVLIPGDISWAMRLDEALWDLEDIVRLPGKKVFIKGNHDYWWTSVSKLRQAFESTPNMYFIQNDSIVLNGIAIAGSRGWTCPQSAGFTTADKKIYNRELVRLELSLKSVPSGIPIVAMLHFPPMAENHAPTGFTELLERYGVKTVVYGHLHGKRSFAVAFEGEKTGIRYKLCSADYIDFSPILIDDLC